MTPEEQKKYDDFCKSQAEEMQAISNLLKRASVEGVLVEVVMFAMDNYVCNPEKGKVQSLVDACYDWDL